MEKIKTIRLYRYNIGITEENDCTEYMTMDYFDSFDVEEEEDIISGCIGNGEKYSYLAMQEMCFKCDEIFRMPDGEKSFFTLIQIFVNPDFIYSDQEDEDDKVSYILKKYIDKFVAYVQEKCKVDYQVFPLITAGDYLVCIRSNDIHVAYDISTVLRDLYFEMGQKRCLLFTTYSILGMKNDIILTDEKLQQLHINEKDLVSIRGIFSDRYREADLEMNPSIDREEYQLYGRYDQTVDISLHDYLQMQNFLVLYKKGKFNEAAECIECFMSKEYQDIKSKELLEKISKGYFSYWNERILLYKRDDFSEFRTNKEQFCVANLPQRKFLKQINTELYIECEELLRDIKEYQTMWERERINTYYNLLERLLEISKNLNYQRELRIHVAILLKQMKSFMSSMHMLYELETSRFVKNVIIPGIRELQELFEKNGKREEWLITYLYNDVCIREEPNGEKKCMLSVKDSYYHDMIWRACNIGGMYKNVQEERKQRAIVSKDKLVEIIEEEFGLNRLVKFEEIMQKGYAKEVVQYLYWARERYEFAVNYIDSISVKYLTDEKDFASMLEEL